MKTYTKDISQRHIFFCRRRHIRKTYLKDIFFFVEEDIYERHISKTYSKLHVKTYTTEDKTYLQDIFTRHILEKTYTQDI